MAIIHGVLMLGWFFLAYGYGHYGRPQSPVTNGPFKGETECKQMARWVREQSQGQIVISSCWETK